MQKRNDELPWQPLFTIERSGVPEVTVYGIVSVVAGTADSLDLKRPLAERYRTLIARGDTDFLMWTRSLLKAWQLLSHIDLLARHYPQLKDEHYALFMSSHSAESGHLAALEAVLALTGVEESALKCPQARPLSPETLASMSAPASRYHNCSGKHSGYLAALNAVGQARDYLSFDHPHHRDLVSILSALTGRDTDTFDCTTDGCQLPNYALSAFEIATFYQTLSAGEKPRNAPEDENLRANFAHYQRLGPLMQQNPRMISGEGRLDYKLMSGKFLGETPMRIAAKEGADGLLGVSVASDRYPHGLGICIKLSSGFDKRHMQLLCREIFHQLGLVPHTGGGAPGLDGQYLPHIIPRFHFELQTNELCRLK